MRHMWHPSRCVSYVSSMGLMNTLKQECVNATPYRNPCFPLYFLDFMWFYMSAFLASQHSLIAFEGCQVHFAQHGAVQKFVERIKGTKKGDCPLCWVLTMISIRKDQHCLVIIELGNECRLMTAIRLMTSAFFFNQLTDVVYVAYSHSICIS